MSGGQLTTGGGDLTVDKGVFFPEVTPWSGRHGRKGWFYFKACLSSGMSQKVQESVRRGEA